MANALASRLWLLLWAGSLTAALLADHGEYQLGYPPPPPTPEAVAAMSKAGPRPLSRTGPFVVDTAIREQVRLFHQLVYVMSNSIDAAWTGDIATCQAGTISPDFRDAVARRINYYRALAGVPAGVVLDETFSGKNQEAALMMSANNALNHFPPTSWSCYTANGSEAARSSNLAIGRFGPLAVDGYMEDFGVGNAAVGHRRWLLYPQTGSMGTGDVPGIGSWRKANAVWVFDGNYGGPRPATRTEYVSWPPPGYVPYQVVYPRWSFSYPGADFSAASVVFMGNESDVPVIVEPVSSGMGEDTLVWHPAELDPDSPYRWPRPLLDVAYQVEIRDVMIGGTPRNFSYSVIVFDPGMPGPDTVLPGITGPSQLTVGRLNEYQLPTVPGATSYQIRVTRRNAFTAVAGAETGAIGFDINVSPGYSVVVTDPRVSGLQAYHLAHPTLTPQYLTYLPLLAPAGNSRLEFQSRLGWATTNQVARVQVQIGGIGEWGDVFVQAGSDGPGENTFNLRSISLDPFVGRSIQIRFVYDGSGGIYYPDADPGVGWYLDDIAIHGAEELQDDTMSAPFPGESFNWTPPAEGDYAIEARAQFFEEFYAEWGPVHAVTAVTATMPPVIRFVGLPTMAAGLFQIEFTVDNFDPELSIHLFRANEVGRAWTIDNSATFESVTPGGRFRVRTAIGASAPGEYFRLGAD